MMRAESKKIVAQILNFIKQSDRDDVSFNQLALALFAFQFQYNLPYKRFCQRRRRTPMTVKEWRQIPALPLQPFKEVTLSCEPAEKAEAVFMTSGTTGKRKRGKNYHPTLDVWDASMVTGFEQFVLSLREKMTIYVLSPAEDMNEHSSLSRYLTMAVKHFGGERSRFFFREGGFDMDGLSRALKECEENREPVLLMGASFAYVHFIDFCMEHRMRFRLPKGSLLFDTGGFKGQSREVEQERLYELFGELFGVDETDCINMYGMTELSSQLYDRCRTGKSRSIREMKGPPWVKTIVLHPDTLEPVKAGETGILAHYDLANWNSSLAILTEDIGYQTNGGFVLLGRMKDSEARGCSVAVDQFMEAHQQ